MKTFGYYKELSIRHKLIVSFIILVLPIALTSGMITTWMLKQSIQKNIESELSNATGAIANMVETTATASIKNYLRAVAEKNLEIVKSLYARFENGEASRESVLETIRQVLLSQHIGKTGYIYCINSEGVATVHPRKQVEGQKHVKFQFVRDQIKLKSGYMEYEWKNPEDRIARPKALYMSYFEPLDWIISVSSYRDEFTELIAVDDFKSSIQSLKFGETGYAYVFDKEGLAIIHPTIEGTNVFRQEPFSDGPAEQMLARKSGKLTYLWKNPGEILMREKLAIFNYIPEFGWVVGSATYLDEVFKPVDYLVQLSLLGIMFGGLMGALMIYFIGNMISSRISQIQNAFTKGADGEFSTRLRIDARDEFGRLSEHFNTFMQQLEDYNADLINEIAERKRVERRLEDSRNKYLQLFEVETDAIFLIEKQDGKIIEANPSASKIYGYSDQEFAAMTMPMLKAEKDEGGLSILKSSTAFAISYHRKKNGDIFPVEIRKRTFAWMNKTIEVATVRDVTKLTESEEKQLRLSMAVEQSSEIVMITDTQARIQYVNSSFESLTGFGKEEVLGRNPRLLSSGKHGREFYQQMWDTLLRGESWRGQIINRKKDGTLFIEDAIISPLINETGELVSYVAAKRDVTKEVELERQLQHIQKIEAIGTLAGGIAHDFNNILSAILGFCELAKIKAVRNPDDVLERYLDNIFSAGNRAKELIKQILQFSRKEKAEFKVVDVEIIINEAVKLLRATIPASIDIKVDVEARFKTVYADPTQIHQVIMNLCTNAYHAMKATGGTITITLNCTAFTSKYIGPLGNLQPGSYLVVAVEDTGEGIAPENLDRIFDPYFSTKTRGDGTGLGLSVTLGIIQGHKGTLSVQSKLNHGTRFEVYLPREVGFDIAISASDGQSPQGNQQHILVVDDEPFFVEIMESYLKILTYKVTSRQSSVEALELLKTHPHRFDGLITDQNMPKMEGTKLISELRAFNPTMPVVLCTGYSDRVSKETAKQYGITEFLMKPVSKNHIAHALHRVFHAR